MNLEKKTGISIMKINSQLDEGPVCKSYEIDINEKDSSDDLSEKLSDLAVEKILDDNKAQNITSINLKNKSYIADYMIIASGTSSRHLQSLSEILVNELKKKGIENCRIEGKDSNDWKLVDAHDVIVHIFHPEKREFYDLEKMWSEEIPKERATL